MPSLSVSRASRKSAALRRPVCTHMMMHRQFGPTYTCCMCGRAPEIGWVYVCHQDSELRRAHDAILNQAQSTTLEPSEGGCLRTMAGLARSLGMSRSVVAGIEAGDYNFEQIDILIAQKEQLNATIRKSEESQPTPTLRSVLDRHDPEPNGVAPLPTAPPGLTPPGTPTTTSTLPPGGKSDSKKLQKADAKGCGVRVCHTCRPQFYDRFTVNLDSILLGEMPAITTQEMDDLHILDVNILRNLDFNRPAIQPLSRDDRQRNFESHAFTDESSEWLPTRANTDDSESESDYNPGTVNNYAFSSIPSSEHVFDDKMRGLDGCAASDLGLQSRMTSALPMDHRRQDQEYKCDTPGLTSSSASSVSLRTPNRHSSLACNVDELPGGSMKAASLCGADLCRRSYSSMEVQVDGGLALTEEAIGHGIPDIITSV